MNIALPLLRGRLHEPTTDCHDTLDDLLDPNHGLFRCHALTLALREQHPSSRLDGVTLFAFARLMRGLLTVGAQLLSPAATVRIRETIGTASGNFTRLLPQIRELFPGYFPVPASQGDAGAAAHPDAAGFLVQLTALALLTINPAASPATSALGLDVLNADEDLAALFRSLRHALTVETVADNAALTIWDVLAAPQLAAPDSLAAQLRLAGETWGRWLGADAEALAVAAAVLSEVDLPRHNGPGPSEVMTFEQAPLQQHRPVADTEHFSSDRQWMQETVLLAKNTHVWLHQCTREYGRPVTRVDEVPDAELARLAERGVTGLWLIGLWQRSPASREIKRRSGNSEALASAYAITGYRIADDLGGDTALDDLRLRAWNHGIRLCGDMVPNHTGIDADWIYDHPERFVSLDHAPYPDYRFDGPELSSRPEISLRIEDRYWDRTDAAVVFRRRDLRSGETRFIYHGNDGTSMPWNDTAQLDFQDAATREAVIQTILGVARRFPIIRFDAAMVLARKHLRRLWHPSPGETSDIASRSLHAMSQEEFNRAVPHEFWREVVDRIAAEAPDTLLLAEAFWLMEGYFVRTLGMHRVYHSAFMHMLRDEDNAKFRTSIKHVLAHDARILHRFVNFMSNPDEDTAESQFGKGDKYFGVCTLLATLPGLPLLGHGQLEGYTEKYGMEFSQAYRDEQPDKGFLAHHQRMIFPLFRKRAMFAGAEHFRLYDALGPDGGILEDVYAFTNRLDQERVLVVCNHSSLPRRFRLHRAWAPPDAKKSEELGAALGVPHDAGGTVELRDPRTDDRHSVDAAALHTVGVELELPAYGCRVFLEISQRPETG